jgi:hypothetical protein
LIRNHRLFGRLLSAFSLLFLPAVGPAAAGAQELYNYTVGVLGGIGGSFDASPGNSLTNSNLQLNLGIVTDPGTHVVLRAGRLALDKSTFFGSLSGADMKYLTIGGEYRYQESTYQSGIYAALGAYRLQGTSSSNRKDSQDTWGASVGFTGELPVKRWLGIQAELSGHYVNFKEAQFFAMAQAGIVFHF